MEQLEKNVVHLRPRLDKIEEEKRKVVGDD